MFVSECVFICFFFLLCFLVPLFLAFSVNLLHKINSFLLSIKKLHTWAHKRERGKRKRKKALLRGRRPRRFFRRRRRFPRRGTPSGRPRPRVPPRRSTRPPRGRRAPSGPLSSCSAPRPPVAVAVEGGATAAAAVVAAAVAAAVFAGGCGGPFPLCIGGEGCEEGDQEEQESSRSREAGGGAAIHLFLCGVCCFFEESEMKQFPLRRLGAAAQAKAFFALSLPPASHPGFVTSGALFLCSRDKQTHCWTRV